MPHASDLQPDAWPRAGAASDARRADEGLAGRPARQPPLPRPPELVGPPERIAQVVEKAASVSQLTIFGPGGVGKTTAALAAARQLAHLHAEGVAFVDLAPLLQAHAVPTTVAAALAMPKATGLNAAELAELLAPRDLLLILDNCDHVVEGAAALCEAIARLAPRCRVIATSREVLRCAGEVVHRLPGLAVPVDDGEMSAMHAGRFPAVQLFVQRATRHRPDFELTDALAPAVAALCRRLDGLPLAIELAAAGARQFGIDELLQRLDQPETWLPSPALPAGARHANLDAMLRWSYEWLDRPERDALERLSLFRSRFPMAAAGAVVADETLPAADVPALVGRLAAKSLLAPQFDGGRLLGYRLLETTRDFALERLRASAGHVAAARRHALYMREILEPAGQAGAATREAWLSTYGCWLDDVRAALDWALSSGADNRLAVALTADAMPLAYQLRLWREFFPQLERATALLEGLDGLAPETEVKLRHARAELVVHLHGAGPETQAMVADALRVAADPTDAIAAAKARDCACMGAVVAGDHPMALTLARGFLQDARAMPHALSTIRAERMLAQACFHMAEHEEAERLALRIARHEAPLPNQPGDSAIDPRVSSRVVLARVAWVRGQPDRSRHWIDQAHALCVDVDAGANTQVQAWGRIAIALWNGEVEQARDALAQLRHVLASQAPYWATWAPLYEWAVSGGRSPLPDWPGRSPAHLDMAATLGREGAPVPHDALARAEQGLAPWCGAEVLRAHAEALIRADPGQRDAAEGVLRRALTLARRQKALAWELRASISLARLWAATGLPLEAADLLSTCLAQFAATLDNADLRRARNLLARL